MKKFSKIIVILLTIAMSLGMVAMLTACDNEEDTGPVNTIVTYKVMFHVNYPMVGDTVISGGSDNFSKSVRQGAKVSVDDDQTPLRPAGYVFDGWYTEADGGELFDFSKSILKNTNIYAHWALNNLATDVELKTSNVFTEQFDTVYYLDEESGTRMSKQVSTGVYLFTGEDAVNGQIPNANKSFNFTTKFKNIVAPTSTWDIFSNEACNKKDNINVVGNQYLTSLSNGNNYFYIKVKAQDRILTKTYKVNVYLEPKYTVMIETIKGSNNFESGEYSHDAKLSAPNIDDAYVGHTFGGWYYTSAYKRNANGDIVDAYDRVLLEEDGVFYLVDENYKKYPAYVDADGNKALLENGKYYKANKNGEAILENDQKIELSQDELYSIVDDNGLPMYETGTPKRPTASSFKTVWDFDTTKVKTNVIIYGVWTTNTYEIKLDLGDKDASFDGTTAGISVEYGIGPNELANRIKNIGSADPQHPYATFIGWYYNDLLMVGPNGVGVNGWNIASNATLTAKWSYDTYKVNVLYNSENGTAVSSSDVCKYNGTITLTATPNEGYIFDSWKIGNKEISKNATMTYTFNKEDLVNNELNIVATFKLIAVTITFEYDPEPKRGIEFADLPLSQEFEFGKELILPEIPGNKSPDGRYIFDYWYIEVVDQDGVKTEVPITIKNVDGNIEIIEKYKLSKFKEDTTIFVKWQPDNYNIKVFESVYKGLEMGKVTTEIGDEHTIVEENLLKEFNAFNYKLSGVEYSVIKDTLFTFKTTINTNINPHYVFKGLYLIKNMNIENVLIKENLEKIIDENLDVEGIQYTLTQNDINIVAIWYYEDINIQLEVTDLSGNTVLTNIVNVPFDTSFNISYVIPSENIPQDYSFDGWYNGFKQFIDHNGNSVISITNDDYYANTLILKTKWKAINYFTINEEGYITGFANDKLDKDTYEIAFDDSVIGIAPSAFEGNKKLKHLTIKGNIMSIGSCAFKDSSIQTITFDGNFKGLTIESNAFENCVGLTNIEFPNNVVEIKEGALRGCENLVSLTYSGACTLGSLFNNVDPNSGSWYQAVQNGVSYWIPVSLTTIKISNTTDTICNNCFENCYKVSSFTLANKIDGSDVPYTLYIGDYAFANSDSKNAVDIQIDMKDIKSIGYYAFMNSGIKSIDISNAANIKDGAFKGCTALTTVDFSKSVIEIISANCFEGCVKLNSVIVGNVVKNIGASAFLGCTSLQYLGNSNMASTEITKIGSSAFANSGITTACINSNFSKVISVGRYAFRNSAWLNDPSVSNSVLIVGSVLYFNNNASSFDFKTNTNIKTIASGAFADSQSNLGNLDLSGMTSLKYIESYAFEKTTITAIKLPESLIQIKANAFRESKIQKVDLSMCSALSIIGKNAFYGCVQLNTLIFNANNYTASGARLVISEQAFRKCSALLNVTLPDNLVYLGEYVFADCTKLNDVKFVDNAKFLKTSKNADTANDPVYSSKVGASLFKYIPVGAFMNDTSLSGEFIIPYFVTEIKDMAFEGCTGITNINGSLESPLTISGQPVENKVDTFLRTIGDKAFMNATNLQSMVLASDFNKLGVSAFENCISLQTLTTVLSNIPNRAFFGCAKLQDIAVSSSVSVGDEAFQSCELFNGFRLSKSDDLVSVNDVGASAFKSSSLGAIKLGSTKVIGAEAFSNTALINVAIPSSVTEIGASAFSACYDLNEVLFESNDTLVKIDKFAFANCSSLTKIELPASLIELGTETFANCDDLISVVIGEQIAVIGDRAFADRENVNKLVVTFLGINAPEVGQSIFHNTQNFTIRVKNGYKNTFTVNPGWAQYDVGVSHFEEYMIP